MQGSHYEVINAEAKALLAEETLLLDIREMNLNSLLTQVKAAQKLADALRDGINQVLVKVEGFGGVENVHFTSFVLQ